MVKRSKTSRRCKSALTRLSELAHDGHQIAVVHGGGSTLTRTLQLLGKKSDFVDGLRITDAETRDVALMVLAGMVNKGVVAAIVAAGVPAVGLCGGDGMAFRARRNKLRDTIWDLSAKFARWNRAGWMPSGGRAEFPCSRRWRWVRTASITT